MVFNERGKARRLKEMAEGRLGAPTITVVGQGQARRKKLLPAVIWWMTNGNG